MKHFMLGSCLFLISICSTTFSADVTSEIHTAVDKSLPFIWKEGQAWIDKRGCVSCHQIPFMVWSLNAASEKGFQIDGKRLNDLEEWSTTIANFVNPKNREQDDQSEDKIATANIDTMGQLLLAIDESRNTSNGEWKQRFSNYLLAAQQKDGTWKACGQLPFQKRPKPETTAVTTLWTAYALLQTDPAVSFHFSRPILNGEATDEIQGVSTEWLAVQLLYAQQDGDSDKVTKLQQKLIDTQREDGGWGWLIAEESDAFGTGIALYALQKSGYQEEASEISSAIQFLLKSQQSDGSWKVRSTKGKHREQVTPTASYWGTAWAVIALLETI